MEHQKKVVIVAPTLTIAEAFWHVTEGLYFTRPKLASFPNLECQLVGVMNTIFFLIPCGQEFPYILSKYKGRGNEFIVVSDWGI